MNRGRRALVVRAASDVGLVAFSHVMDRQSRHAGRVQILV
jgi:hypothetical protein